MHKKTAVELKESHIGAKILLEIESKDFFKPIFPFLFSGVFLNPESGKCGDGGFQINGIFLGIILNL